MREAFDAMGDHPFVTFFVGLIFIVVVHEITEIFKKPKKEEEKNESE
jgi:hypothetical protein